ncbi:DUF6124 family protein [Pseudomonas sp. GM25]|uniref:DUF6124 family protein n=1 Tax=Pseudomonas sp. GM25 TaxID=1144327 RepID=UPI00027014F0|nr:DUF6124 family protein [Pseudomonas sp. GM25]EJM30912.1 hypothetical protein PMI24_00941 [Pseudomonas sp. GM25]
MFKITPNPPDADPIPYDAALEAENIKTATERAINHYLDPGAQKTSKPSRKPGKIYLVNPTMDDETLLVEACETLSSASDMARDIGETVDPSQRKAMQILQQVIMLSELLVNRVLDNHHVSR